MAAPARSELLSLLRSLIRTGRKFSDYNIREYVKRRSVDAFRANKGLPEPEAAAAAAEGRAQLAVAERQCVVDRLYAGKAKSVMEIQKF